MRVASNGSYFGIRARHNLTPYGYPGLSVVAQLETLIEAAAAPTERAAIGTRDSFLGLESPWGAIKGGKSDTPYKKATAAFDPFANTLGDYNSIMGNTGGDNRAEFDWRMNHAIWYESPILGGFQFSALVSPGQNYAPDNSDYSYGDYFQCNGASARGSGSNFPNTGGAVPGNIGGNGCTDGSFGNAYSAAGTYKNGPFVPASWCVNSRYKTAALVSAQRLPGITELRMRYLLPTATAALIFVVSCSAAFASPYDWSYQGQYPLPPSLSDRTAQPECGLRGSANRTSSNGQLTTPAITRTTRSAPPSEISPVDPKISAAAKKPPVKANPFCTELTFPPAV